MWIERATWPGKCRHCGAAIEFARRGSTGRAIAINPPVVLAPALLTAANPNLVDLDLRRTTLHVATCSRWRELQEKRP